MTGLPFPTQNDGLSVINGHTDTAICLTTGSDSPCFNYEELEREPRDQAIESLNLCSGVSITGLDFASPPFLGFEKVPTPLY